MQDLSSHEPILEELVCQWMEAQRSDTTLSIDQLCGPRVDLRTEMERQIGMLKSMSWLDEQLDEQLDSRQFNAPEELSEIAMENKVLGNYELLSAIGAGGMGQLYKAIHLHMRRQVAIKLLPRAAVNSPAAVSRFRREIEVLGALEHPHIVTAYDAGEHEGQQYLVMQFIEGTDLAKQVERHGPLTLHQALSVLFQVALGLDYVHSKGIVHRDIKPSNLMLDPNGVIKILDLGLAQFIRSGPSMPIGASGATDATGTIDYMSPEQAQEGARVDARADMYSLGCTLFFMLTGRAMFGGQTPLKRHQNHLTAPIPDLRSLCHDIPDCVQSLFGQMVAKHRDDRLPSMARLQEEIQRCAAEINSLMKPSTIPLYLS